MLVVPNIISDIVTNASNNLQSAVCFAKFALVVVVSVLEERVCVDLDL